MTTPTGRFAPRFAGIAAAVRHGWQACSVVVWLAAAAASTLALAGGARAETIANPIAQFSGLDKITGRITKFDVYMNETVLFGYADTAPTTDRAVLAGALLITPRACYTRPTTEVQRTSVFIEVDRVGDDGASTRIFTGWMFADSPALNAIDDPVYDVWLVGCTQKTDVPRLQQAPEGGPPEPAAAPAPAGAPAAAAPLPTASPAPAVTTPSPAAPATTQALVFDDRG